ncbi:MAG TPA: PAC2 family protein [Egibacteraceae bacterium]|nr:PAC2 family protein [Egibacteraceae bacterium]
MANVVTIRTRPPKLRRPALIAAFQGWNDAGESASGTVEFLAAEMDAGGFAEIDPEEFFDFQATRPLVRNVDGERRIDWPGNLFSWARVPGADRDVVLLQGTEPNLRWRTFTAAVVHLARDIGVELAVTLGALQVDAPHTREVPVTGNTNDLVLGARLGLRPSHYEGPTGITGILHQACADAGLQSASLWAGIPHYLAGTSYLAGTLALVEAVVGLLDADVSVAPLVKEAASQREELSELVAQDADLAEYVSELEARMDAAPDELPQPSVSGDELAADFERYLRDRDEG